MSVVSYVENLPLAALDLPAAGARRNLAGSKPASVKTDIADIKAAVDASSLLSFVDGIEGAQKEDVLYSIQFAQRAASADHDRFDETPAWYRRYVDVLENLGWAGEQFVFSASEEGEGEVQMDKSALNAIAAIATGNQLTILTESIEALEALAGDDDAIDLFEFQSSNIMGGNFQIGAIQKGQHDLLSIALGAFYFRATERKKRFLFVKWRKKEVNMWTAAQRMVFNPGIYSAVRDIVRERLRADAMKFIANVPLD